MRATIEENAFGSNAVGRMMAAPPLGVLDEVLYEANARLALHDLRVGRERYGLR
jgi:hypothetical protein